jgi:hypothetical protein
VVIQVDGLSHLEFEKALERGTMPATSRLRRRGAVRAHRLRTALPTSVPAPFTATGRAGRVSVTTLGARAGSPATG